MNGEIRRECRVCGSKITTTFWLEEGMEQIDKFKSVGVGGNRIVRLVFRKLKYKGYGLDSSDCG
jgi:hypothetical protein